MKILFDECLPKKLKYELINQEIKTVPEMGWAGKTNGELISLAQQQFDVFITVDKKLVHQQNLQILVSLLFFSPRNATRLIL